MAAATTGQDVLDWLSRLDSEKRQIVDATREIIGAGRHGMRELIYHDALGYSTSDSAFDRVLYVAVSAGHVTLGFFFGAALDDPRGLLRGDGKRMRHVRLGGVADVRNPDLAELVQHAVQDGPSQVRRLHQARRT